MTLRSIAVWGVVLSVCVPGAAFAQSSDDVILNLLKSLEAPIQVPTVSVKATTTQSTQPTQPAAKSPAPSAVAQVILAPLYLYDIDANTQKPDPEIGNLKSMLAALVQQFAVLSSNTPQASTASTSAATSTTPVVPKKTYLRDLTIGSRGEDVRALQQLLITRGFLFGEVTGYFGILTKTAVMAFQTDMSLPSVGNVGPKTRALLNSIPLGTSEEGTVSGPVAIGPVGVATTASSTSISTVDASSTASTTAATGTWGKPVTVSMTILPTEAPVGGSVSVTWLSQNADSCTASDGWGGAKPTIGAAIIEPLDFSLNFVLTCTGAGGVASTSALVVVGGEQ